MGFFCAYSRKYKGISLVITPAPPPPPSLFSLQPRSDEAVRIYLRERGHNVLVLQRVSSEWPALPASTRGGGREEARHGR